MHMYCPVRLMVFWPPFVGLGPCNPVGRFLGERDPSVAPSTLPGQLTYQCNLLMLLSPEGSQHSMRIKAALNLFY